MSAPNGKKRLLLAAIAVAALGGGGWYALQLGNRGDQSLHVYGNIEAIEVPISFKIPGHVVRRYLDEGQAVKEGQVIAELESRDVAAEVAMRRGDLHAAQAALAEMLAGSRPEEIDASKAIYLAAEADRERLKLDLDRADDLRSKHPGAISKEQYDQSVAAFRMGDQRFVEAQKRYRLVEEGPRKEDIDQARAKVEQAEAALQAAEVKLGYATVRSPLTGVVLSKNVEPGEYVAAGTPIVTVADNRNVWLRGYVDERDVGTRGLALDAKADVTTDAYPGKVYQGRIGFISEEQEFTPKSVETPRERVKFVYRIKIYVTNENQELKPGMPAEAKIKLD